MDTNIAIPVHEGEIHTHKNRIKSMVHINKKCMFLYFERPLLIFATFCINFYNSLILFFIFYNTFAIPLILHATLNLLLLLAIFLTFNYIIYHIFIFLIFCCDYNCYYILICANDTHNKQMFSSFTHANHPYLQFAAHASRSFVLHMFWIKSFICWNK